MNFNARLLCLAVAILHLPSSQAWVPTSNSPRLLRTLRSSASDHQHRTLCDQRLIRKRPAALTKSNGSGSPRRISALCVHALDPAEQTVLVSDKLDLEESPVASDPVTSTVTIDNDIMMKKVVNALLLAVSFGYAAYTILNIDHGMTRGWTQSEIALRIPFDVWSGYETSLEEKPIYTKTLINVVIYLLGDWLSQTAFQKKNILDFDAWRTLRNGFIGLCFGPLVHEYYQFSDHILPVEGGLMNRVEKVFMDQTIYLTVKCSMYIAAVGFLQGDDAPTVKASVQDRIGGVVITAWKFWPLVHCITYGVIPARHRILWVNCVDLVWNAILASLSQAKPTEDETALQADSIDVPHQMGFNLTDASSDPFLLSQEVLPSSREQHLEGLFDVHTSNDTIIDTFVPTEDALVSPANQTSELALVKATSRENSTQHIIS